MYLRDTSACAIFSIRYHPTMASSIQETEKSRARTSRSRERAERAERERGFQPRTNRGTWAMPRG